MRHPEGVLQRLSQILSTEAPVESILIGGWSARVFTCCRSAVASSGWALVGFGAAGFGWGYLAGASRSLDFLQPGRHTFAFFTALALAGGAATRRGAQPTARSALRIATARSMGNRGRLCSIGIRLIGYGGGYSAIQLLGTFFTPEPFLSSQPSTRAALGRRSRRPASQAGRATALRRRGLRRSAAFPIRSRADGSAASCPSAPASR